MEPAGQKVLATDKHGWTQISNFCFQLLAAPKSDAGGSEFQILLSASASFPAHTRRMATHCVNNRE
jgi:hypothetical protein